jgi:hypothetical protein
MHHHGQKQLPWRHWLKWVVVADLDHRILVRQTARICPPSSKRVPRLTRIRPVVADAEFDCEK